MKTIENERTRLFERDFVFESIEDAQNVLKKENKKSKLIKIAAITYVIAMVLAVLICDVIRPNSFVIKDIASFGAVGVLFAYSLLMFPINLKFAVRVFCMFSPIVIFWPIKLLFGLPMAIGAMVLGSFTPVYSTPAALWQSHLIKKAAKEYIDTYSDAEVDNFCFINQSV